MVRDRFGRRGISAVAIFLTAVALQRACTLAWGQGRSPAGTAYEISVVGLSRLPDAATAQRNDCRWWPRYGDAALCGPLPGGESAHVSLRRAYPLLQVALWLSVASLLLQALRVPRQRFIQASLPASACALTTTAVIYMMRGARDGLAALEGVPIAFTGAGALLAMGACVASALSATIVLTSFTATAPVDAPPLSPTSDSGRTPGSARGLA